MACLVALAKGAGDDLIHEPPDTDLLTKVTHAIRSLRDEPHSACTYRVCDFRWSYNFNCWAIGR